jgi:6-phospho-beta-glucosidase
LNRRNASYMRLEGAGESALTGAEPDWDPFAGATGYHRIAVQAIHALTSPTPEVMILNVPNRGCIEGLAPDDIVEVPCVVDHNGPRPIAVGALPSAVRGLVFALKHSERLTVQAAAERRWDTAVLALALNPIAGNWEAARGFLARLAGEDLRDFSDFTRSEILLPEHSKT